jgi:hypothetical protein
MIFSNFVFKVEKESITMKRTVIFVLAASLGACAQESGNIMFKTMEPMGRVEVLDKGPAPVKGAPYSATTTSESTQTLADGNHISQTSTGSVARDSMGRTRQDTALPTIGTLSAANLPRLVFIRDPVAGTSFTLNLTDKTAWKSPMISLDAGSPGTQIETNTVIIRTKDGGAPAMPPPPPAVEMMRHIERDDDSQATTESLGSQTIEGVFATGVRTTRTIPAGQIGNERPINIVTEVWTTPDLKIIVSSKRDDPRMGEQTFKLTNIVRGEPDASLFTVPADFKIVDGGKKTFFYKTNQ